MKTLEVRYCGWGEDWQLGTLEVAGHFHLLATAQPIRRDNIAHMLRAVESNRLALV